MGLLTSDFDYELPAELIAQNPLLRRDASRLMVLHRTDGLVTHHVFAELPALLREADLLVLNDTRVIPAKFTCRRRTGGKIEGLFLREASAGVWEVMFRGAGRCRSGERLALLGPQEVQVELRLNLGEGQWQVDVKPPLGAVEILEHAGRTPLPPYIRRRRRADDADDRNRYQTVYADKPGAVAAPTAGLHFTPELLAELHRRGILTARVTLHVGPGTFLPVKAQRVRQHTMHAEWYELGASTAELLNGARRERRRIVAVGTTSARVLETVVGMVTSKPTDSDPWASGKEFRPCSGWTSVFIHPPYRFLGVDALITNFHLPRSTLLMLVAAFCQPGRTDGVRMILDAYAQAVRAKYRFYSYGDAMLIE
jgi:S-adenosylmethionine:tRNA ribosyltransferase-isomerase